MMRHKNKHRAEVRTKKANMEDNGVIQVIAGDKSNLHIVLDFYDQVYTKMYRTGHSAIYQLVRNKKNTDRDLVITAITNCDKNFVIRITFNVSVNKV